MLRRSPSGEADFVFDWVFADPPVGNGAGGRKAYARRRPATWSASGSTTKRGGSGHGVRGCAETRWVRLIMDAAPALKTIAMGELAFTDPGAIHMTGRRRHRD